jgi:hypothetical protein
VTMNAGSVRKAQTRRSLVQGAELKVKAPGLLPWYSLEVLEMDGLPCAIPVPATSSSHRLPGRLHFFCI